MNAADANVATPGRCPGIASVVFTAEPARLGNPSYGPTGTGDERQYAQASHQAAMSQKERKQEAHYRRGDGILTFDQQS